METPPAPLRPPTAVDVDEAVARIVRAFDPVRIDVFGSVARGDEQAGSDLDLLIVFETLDRADKRPTAVRALRALDGLSVPADVVVTSPEEIARRGRLVGSVLREALQHGRTVYTRLSGDGV